VPRRLAGSASAPTLKAPRLSRAPSDKGGVFTPPCEASLRTTVRDGVPKEQIRHLFRGTPVSARALRPRAAPPDNAAAQPLQRQPSRSSSHARTVEQTTTSLPQSNDSSVRSPPPELCVRVRTDLLEAWLQRRWREQWLQRSWLRWRTSTRSNHGIPRSADPREDQHERAVSEEKLDVGRKEVVVALASTRWLRVSQELSRRQEMAQQRASQERTAAFVKAFLLRSARKRLHQVFRCWRYAAKSAGHRAGVAWRRSHRWAHLRAGFQAWLRLVDYERCRRVRMSQAKVRRSALGLAIFRLGRAAERRAELQDLFRLRCAFGGWRSHSETVRELSSLRHCCKALYSWRGIPGGLAEKTAPKPDLGVNPSPRPDDTSMLHMEEPSDANPLPGGLESRAPASPRAQRLVKRVDLLISQLQRPQVACKRRRNDHVAAQVPGLDDLGAEAAILDLPHALLRRFTAPSRQHDSDSEEEVVSLPAADAREPLPGQFKKKIITKQLYWVTLVAPFPAQWFGRGHVQMQDLGVISAVATGEATGRQLKKTPSLGETTERINDLVREACRGRVDLKPFAGQASHPIALADAVVQRMTKAEKQVLLATYLGSYVNNKDDRRLFLGLASRRKVTVRKKKEDDDIPCWEKAPKSVSLMRLVAIYHKLALARTSLLLGNHFWLTLVSLKEAGFVRIRNERGFRIDRDIKVDSLASLYIARACAMSLEIDLAEYLC
ncbi:unnamed protein product, partial [Symbiodinium sp. CCMP2456]